jgi:hypothetical protein
MKNLASVLLRLRFFLLTFMKGIMVLPSAMLFPHEIRVSTDPVKWMSMNSAYVDECVHKYGMVRFPFNHVDSPDKFSELLQHYDGHDFFDGSMSAAPRKMLADGVYTANEAPSSSVIPFHHEMAQCNESPNIVAFACTQPATEGGATNIADSGLVAAYMKNEHREVSDMLEERGVRYVRRLEKEDNDASATGRSWVTTFGTDDELAVESILSRDGFDWEWSEGDSLVLVSPLKPPFRTVQTRGGASEVFFNSIIAATFGWDDVRREGGVSTPCTFGDGGKFDIRTLHALWMCKRYLETIKIPVVWERGEFILIDNTRVLHSREAFVGPRRVITSMLS